MSEVSPSIHQHPTDLLQCYGEAFGHVISLEMSEGKGLSPEVKIAVDSLRKGITTLLESPASSSMRTIDSINANFRTNDRTKFNQAMPPEQGVGKNVLDWLAGADDEAFVKLALWNVERKRALEAQLLEDSEELIEDTFQRTKNLMELDYFPANALKKVQKASKKFAPFKAMDSFEAGAMSANGYFNSEVITLANLYQLSSEQIGMSPRIKNTTFHEMLHATGTGFFSSNKALINTRILEESFVSHSAAVAAGYESGRDQVAVYDPNNRVGGSEYLSYTEERQVMGYLSEPDVGNIPPDLWATAFFSDKDSDYRPMLLNQIKLGFTAIRSDNPKAYKQFTKQYEKLWVTADHDGRSKLMQDFEKDVLEMRGYEYEVLSDDEVEFESDDFMSWVIHEPIDDN
jgi:hypothetical protein